MTLTMIFILAMCALATIEIVRAFPFIERRTLSGVRPWSCDRCMSFWGCLAWHLGYLANNPHVSPELVFPLMGSVGICLVLLNWINSLAPATGPTEPPT